MASQRSEANRLRKSTAPIDWATAVESIVRRTPASGSQPSDLRAQVRLLALLGSAAPLNELLNGLATYVETWAEGLLCAVLLVDQTGRLLVGGAAPSLPATYGRAIGPVPIEEGRGSCGTAAARREMVIVEDIEHSELWTEYAPNALAHGLRACWSVPILDDSRALLGTLALYYHERRAPSVQETEIIQFASSLAAFVIQRHRDAERLRASDARVNAAVWGTDIGLWNFTPPNDCQWFDNWCERFDIDPCSGRTGLVRWKERVHPDDLEAYIAADRPCRLGTASQYAVEYRLRNRNGEWRWIHERGRVTSRDNDGTARTFSGVCIDIDEQKQTQTALRQAQDRYELAINAARLPVWEFDVESDAVTGNIHWHRALGRNLTDDQARTHVETWLSDVHPDDCRVHEYAFAGGTADPTGFYQSEFRVRVENDGYKWLQDRGRVIERAADGTARKVVGIAIDIDERRKMEAALRESEERGRAILDAIPDLMLRLDREGVFLDYRLQRPDDVFAPPGEVVGARLRDLAPAALANQVHEHIDRALDERTVQQWEFQLGSPRGPQDFEARMVACGPDDVVAIVRNITTFKAADRALRDSLREKEALLKEVHHRVKNNLQVITSLINMQLRRLKDTTARETLEQCQHRVQAIALIHEKLYQSKTLASVSLSDYIRSLAQGIIAAASVPTTAVSLVLAIADLELPIDQAIPCGLILNELIANALKHAFPDQRKGTIQVSCDRVEGTLVRLIVADNGVGMPAHFDFTRCHSMGLQLVGALAGQLHGDFEIDTDAGARFQLTFPLES
jgi:two-component sensor histidine kinase/PAS domain-containing protein